jgi:hypothetical protein
VRKARVSAPEPASAAWQQAAGGTWSTLQLGVRNLVYANLVYAVMSLGYQAIPRPDPRQGRGGRWLASGIPHTASGIPRISLPLPCKYSPRSGPSPQCALWRAETLTDNGLGPMAGNVPVLAEAVNVPGDLSSWGVLSLPPPVARAPLIGKQGAHNKGVFLACSTLALRNCYQRAPW